MNKGKKQEMKALLEHESVKSWRLLMGAFQGIYRRLEGSLLQEGCSISRFQILLHLYFDGPLPATSIAQRLFVTRGNISMFIRRLQTEGLVEIAEDSPSEGRPLYTLTPAGTVLFESIFPRHIQRVKKLMPSLTPETGRELEEILEKIPYF